jgi:uroporphyrinogen decarboxylase
MHTCPSPIAACAATAPMTHRERWLASLACRPVDRCFRYEHGPWPTTRERWVGEGMPQDAEFSGFFGMDPVVWLPIASGHTNSPFYPLFERTVIDETDGVCTFVDTDGVTKKELVRERDTSMPQFLRFPVQNRADWAAVRRRLDPADATARIGDPAALRRRCTDPDVPTMMSLCGAFGHPSNLLGDEALSYLLFDDPGLVEEMIANWRDLYLALLREVTAVVRVDSLLIWEDMCYRNGPLMSPAHVRRFMLPAYQAVIGEARRLGVQGIIVDTDGDCRSLIPVFREAGVDCLMPFEVQAGMDVVEIRRLYPGLCIMGGIDKRALARDHAAIEAEVARVAGPLTALPGFIPTLDHTVPPDVSLEHFRHYRACLRRYEPVG